VGLYLGSIDKFNTDLIARTEGAESPFFSPNGKEIGYWSAVEKKLMRTAISGGAAIPITNSNPIPAATWLEDNTILFSEREGKGIMRVSADGGTPTLMIRAGDNEGLAFPQILADGESVLFSFTRRSPVPMED
jgi:Tol biopolymer transport system component